MRRNLLFYLYPMRGTIWTWHIDQLLRYRDAWNGKKVVILATSHETEKEESVRERLAPLGAEILVRPNRTYLSEAAYFVEGLSRMESLDPNEATFYAHAKGVTRRDPQLEWIRKWCEAMWILLCAHPEAIDRKLARHAAVGCFRLAMNHSGSPWHYSGTFFWLRHDAIFSRAWRDVIQEKHGVEAYPGRHLRFEEACCLTREDIPAIWLYEGWVTDEAIRQWEGELLREDAAG